MMIREKLKEWDRVIKLSRKPKRSEFIMIAKITGLGMIVVGTIGFIIRMSLQITGINL
ncbi:MAG: protein translocase SEC61 complex subunit gamma [Candidatus Hydrothermarchaeaceae archaeon]